MAMLFCGSQRFALGRASFFSFKLLPLLVCAAATHAVTQDDAFLLADLSLEELAAIPVISVTKKEMPVSEAAASVFVITERDIRNAGANSLPEALRLAPNLQVARVDARNYAVTARGFNNPFENKLQVLIDGRTVYSPLFSGVYWDAQDVVLEDLKRIEVVSGAGGTLWGANAVNGVINIVTRSAAETQGTLVSVSGSGDGSDAAIRYGSTLGDGYYRVYAKHMDQDDSFTEGDISTKTGWQRNQAGFRMDWGGGDEAATLQGDAYTGKLHQFNTRDIEISGANLLGRRSWQLEDSTLQLQAYFDHTHRDQPNAFRQNLNTADVQIQQAITLASMHHIVWGSGYRYANDNIENDKAFAFLPAKKGFDWWNMFLQDEIALSDQVKWTLGSKWERNPYTGWEAMPATQISWTPDANKLVWAGVSRAVRSPSRIDRDIYSPTNPAVVNGVPQYVIAGGPDFVSEIAQVAEIGYRSQPVARISWSTTLFYSKYDKLRTLEFNKNGPGLVFQNQAEATSYGMEFWGSWQATGNWRLHAGLVAQHFDVELKSGSMDLSKTTALSVGDPRNYWQLRSSYNLGERVDLNATFRHVAELENTKVPAYNALDLHLGWHFAPKTELSLMAQNLLPAEHVEFGAKPGRSQFERTLIAKLVWGM